VRGGERGNGPAECSTLNNRPIRHRYRPRSMTTGTCSRVSARPSQFSFSHFLLRRRATAAGRCRTMPLKIQIRRKREEPPLGDLSFELKDIAPISISPEERASRRDVEREVSSVLERKHAINIAQRIKKTMN